MAENEQFTLPNAVDSLRKELDPKIESKVPIWVLTLVAGAIITLSGIMFSTLYSQMSNLTDKVNQLDKNVGIINQKMDDRYPHK